jgi:hypothetical protein
VDGELGTVITFQHDDLEDVSCSVTAEVEDASRNLTRVDLRRVEVVLDNVTDVSLVDAVSPGHRIDFHLMCNIVLRN